MRLALTRCNGYLRFSSGGAVRWRSEVVLILLIAALVPYMSCRSSLGAHQGKPLPAGWPRPRVHLPADATSAVLDLPDASYSTDRGHTFAYTDKMGFRHYAIAFRSRQSWDAICKQFAAGLEPDDRCDADTTIEGVRGKAYRNVRTSTRCLLTYRYSSQLYEIVFIDLPAAPAK
jgi:hypothetical protein